MIQGRPGLAYFELREAGKKNFHRMRRRDWIRIEKWEGPHPEGHQEWFEFCDFALKIDTDYEFRAVTLVQGRRFKGQIERFHSGGFSPVILSLTADAITPASFRLSTLIDPRGVPFSVYFEWGTNAFIFNRSPVVTINERNNPVSISVLVEGLAPNSTYWYGIEARNNYDHQISSDQFTTGEEPN